MYHRDLFLTCDECGNAYDPDLGCTHDGKQLCLDHMDGYTKCAKELSL